jgi:hypothetical protein
MSSSSRQRLEVEIHEALHQAFYDLDESVVLEVGKTYPASCGSWATGLDDGTRLTTTPTRRLTSTDGSTLEARCPSNRNATTEATRGMWNRCPGA